MQKKACVLVPQGCCNKSPLVGWLKSTEIRALRILEARSTKSRCQEFPTPYRGSGEESVLGLSASGGSRPSLAFFGLWPQSAFSVLHLSSHHLLSVSLSSPRLSLIRKLITGFRAYPDNLG